MGQRGVVASGLQLRYCGDMQEYAAAMELLRSAGLRATQPRLRVLSILDESKYPLSVADIARTLKSPTVDQVTVYRTLETFVQAGIVQHLELHQGRSFFELATREHHHHLVCRSCGKVEDVEGCDMEHFEKKVAKRSKNFDSVSSHALEFFGDCKECVSV